MHLELIRSPSDEILLTELGIDCRETIVYDISALVSFGKGIFKRLDEDVKCYFDVDKKEFFIELDENTPYSSFSRQMFMKIIEIAEEANAKKIYACIRNSMPDKSKIYDYFVINIFLGKYVKTFLYIGFKQLSLEEAKMVSYCETHSLMCCELKNEEINLI